MIYLLATVLIAAGCVQLLMNESCVEWKRRWKPWWRNDQDARRDRQLKGLLRLATYLSGIVLVELGLYLVGIEAIAWYGRAVLYAVWGLVLLFRSRRQLAI